MDGLSMSIAVPVSVGIRMKHCKYFGAVILLQFSGRLLFPLPYYRVLKYFHSDITLVCLAEVKKSKEQRDTQILNIKFSDFPDKYIKFPRGLVTMLEML